MATGRSPRRALPGRPSCCPAARTRSWTCRPTTGAALVGGQWRYADARVEEIDFVERRAGRAGPARPRRRAEPHLRRRAPRRGARLRRLRLARRSPPAETHAPPRRRPRVLQLVPHRGDDPRAGRRLRPHRLRPSCSRSSSTTTPRCGSTASCRSRWATPAARSSAASTRPTASCSPRDARPGERFTIAVFGINGPISASPRNYIWMRTATLDFYAADRAAAAEPAELEVAPTRGSTRSSRRARVLERVAGGFEFTEGPLWSPDGALLFSSPNTNVIYRLDPTAGRVTVFRSKSGYAGVDIGRYHQPGSNGLTFDPQGRLTMCQHGNRRVLRVNPHGDTTVLADRYDGRRLNSPNDLVYRSDGTLYFTDPPFGLPDGVRRPGEGAAVQRRLRASATATCRSSPTSCAGPTASPSRPTSATCTSATGTPTRKVVMRYDARRRGRLRRGPLRHDRRARRGRDRRHQGRPRAATSTSAAPAASGSSRPTASSSALLELPEAPHNLAWGDADGRALYVTALTSIYRLRLASRIRPSQEDRHEQEPRTRHRHPRLRAARRERRRCTGSRSCRATTPSCCTSAAASTARASASTTASCCSFHELCSVAFTELVTILPNDQHDVFKLKISTGARWTFLSDADLEVQRALRHQRVHRPATTPRRRAAHADRSRPAS